MKQERFYREGLTNMLEYFVCLQLSKKFNEGCKHGKKKRKTACDDFYYYYLASFDIQWKNKQPSFTVLEDGTITMILS